ncbi:MAG: hypothetical protein ABI785_02840 [Gemmatimonadales bacterium]
MSRPLSWGYSLSVKRSTLPRFRFLPRPFQLVLSAAALACTGESVNVATTGILSVVTSTSGAKPDPDGYTLVLNSDDGQSIGATDTLQVNDLPAGDYTVQLQSVALNCAVSAENPRTVRVEAGQTGSTAFAIACPGTAATLRITTSTNGPFPDPDGYWLIIDGVGTYPNGEGIFLGPAAELRRIVIPGAHTVELGGMEVNCQVTGDNPLRLLIPADVTTLAAFEITCEATGDIGISAHTDGEGTDPDGYLFRVDGGVPEPIDGKSDRIVARLAVGPHTVQLSGLSGNCSVYNENPRQITVRAAERAIVNFPVSCVAASRQLGLTTQPSAEAQRGVKLAMQPVVQLQDGAGGPLAQGGVRVEAKVATGGGALEGTTTRITDANGRAAYEDLVIANAGGEHSLRFEAPGSGFNGVTSERVLVSPSTAYQVTELDFMPVKINDLGHIAGTRTGSFSGGIVLWRDGVATGLGSPGVTGTVTGLNNHDVVVGYSGGAAMSQQRGFLWDGTMHDLGPAFIPHAINDAGQLAGRTPAGWLLRDGDNSTPLNCFPGAINNLGQVAGRWTPPERYDTSPCYWDGALQGLPLEYSGAHDINDQTVIVGNSDYGFNVRAFVWRDGVITGLPNIGSGSKALALNEAGAIVGASGETYDGAWYPVLWEHGTVTRLGDQFGEAQDINASGLIVGFYGVGLPSRGVLWTPSDPAARSRAMGAR